MSIRVTVGNVAVAPNPAIASIDPDDPERLAPIAQPYEDFREVVTGEGVTEQVFLDQYYVSTIHDQTETLAPWPPSYATDEPPWGQPYDADPTNPEATGFREELLTDADGLNLWTQAILGARDNRLGGLTQAAYEAAALTRGVKRVLEETFLIGQVQIAFAGETTATWTVPGAEPGDVVHVDRDSPSDPAGPFFPNILRVTVIENDMVELVLAAASTENTLFNFTVIKNDPNTNIVGVAGGPGIPGGDTTDGAPGGTPDWEDTLAEDEHSGPYNPTINDGQSILFGTDGPYPTSGHVRFDEDSLVAEANLLGVFDLLGATVEILNWDISSNALNLGNPGVDETTVYSDLNVIHSAGAHIVLDAALFSRIQSAVSLENYTVATYTGTGNHNVAFANYDNIAVVHFNTLSPSTTTGIVPGLDGQILVITNQGEQPITLTHNDANSDAANRMLLPDNLDVVLSTRHSVILWYDPEISRWVAIGATGELGAGEDTWADTLARGPNSGTNNPVIDSGQYLAYGPTFAASGNLRIGGSWFLTGLDPGLSDADLLSWGSGTLQMGDSTNVQFMTGRAVQDINLIAGGDILLTSSLAARIQAALTLENYIVYSGTGTVNDLTLTSYDNIAVIHLDGLSTLTITGLVPYLDGQIYVFTNHSDFSVTFSHDDLGSTAANRFLLPDNVDAIVPRRHSIIFWYNPELSRWVAIGATGELGAALGGEDWEETLAIGNTTGPTQFPIIETHLDFGVAPSAFGDIRAEDTLQVTALTQLSATATLLNWNLDVLTFGANTNVDQTYVRAVTQVGLVSTNLFFDISNDWDALIDADITFTSPVGDILNWDESAATWTIGSLTASVVDQLNLEADVQAYIASNGTGDGVYLNAIAGDLRLQAANATRLLSALTVENYRVYNTASTLVSNVDFVDKNNIVVVRANPTGGALTVTGFLPYVTGQIMVWLNISNESITFPHESASSDPSNRILGPSTGNITIFENEAVMFWHDPDADRWVPIADSARGSIVFGLTWAQTLSNGNVSGTNNPIVDTGQYMGFGSGTLPTTGTVRFQSNHSLVGLANDTTDSILWSYVVASDTLAVGNLSDLAQLNLLSGGAVLIAADGTGGDDLFLDSAGDLRQDAAAGWDVNVGVNATMDVGGYAYISPNLGLYLGSDNTLTDTASTFHLGTVGSGTVTAAGNITNTAGANIESVAGGEFNVSVGGDMTFTGTGVGDFFFWNDLEQSLNLGSLTANVTEFVRAYADTQVRLQSNGTGTVAIELDANSAGSLASLALRAGSSIRMVQGSWTLEGVANVATGAASYPAYSPTGFGQSQVVVESSAVNIQGIALPSIGGKRFMLFVPAGNTVTIQNESASATTPANRVLTQTGGTLTLVGPTSVWLYYETVSQDRWVVDAVGLGAVTPSNLGLTWAAVLAAGRTSGANNPLIAQNQYIEIDTGSGNPTSTLGHINSDGDLYLYGKDTLGNQRKLVRYNAASNYSELGDSVAGDGLRVYPSGASNSFWSSTASIHLLPAVDMFIGYSTFNGFPTTDRIVLAARQSIQLGAMDTSETFNFSIVSYNGPTETTQFGNFSADGNLELVNAGDLRIYNNNNDIVIGGNAYGIAGLSDRLWMAFVGNIDIQGRNTGNSAQRSVLSYLQSSETLSIGQTNLAGTLGIYTGGILDLGGAAGATDAWLAPWASMPDQSSAVSAATPVLSNYGRFWVRNDATTTPYFTDDANVEHRLAYLSEVSLTWAQVLAAGNNSGANNPIVAAGQYMGFGTTPSSVGQIRGDQSFSITARNLDPDTAALLAWNGVTETLGDLTEVTNMDLFAAVAMTLQTTSGAIELETLGAAGNILLTSGQHVHISADDDFDVTAGGDGSGRFLFTGVGTTRFTVRTGGAADNGSANDFSVNSGGRINMTAAEDFEVTAAQAAVIFSDDMFLSGPDTTSTGRQIWMGGANNNNSLTQTPTVEDIVGLCSDDMFWIPQDDLYLGASGTVNPVSNRVILSADTSMHFGAPRLDIGRVIITTTGTQNAWVPGAPFVLWGEGIGSATLTINGIATAGYITTGYAGTIWVFNSNTAGNIVWNHNNAGATAAERIFTSTGGTVTQTANQLAMVFYSSAKSRWVLKIIG